MGLKEIYTLGDFLVPELKVVVDNVHNDLEGVFLIDACGNVIDKVREEVDVVEFVGTVIDAALSALCGNGEHGQPDDNLVVSGNADRVVLGDDVCRVESYREFACGGGVDGEAAEGDGYDAYCRRNGLSMRSVINLTRLSLTIADYRGALRVETVDLHKAFRLRGD